MAVIKPEYKALIDNALPDGAPCLLGTVSADGQPEISPKGSTVVYDGDHLAFWERSNRGAARNLSGNDRVVVYYRNPAKSDQLPRGAALRFYGRASRADDPAVRDKVYDMIVEQERKADPDKAGHVVMVKIDRVTDLRGEPA